MKSVTAAEMAALDRRAVEEFGIPILDLMENAGRAAAEQISNFVAEELGRNLADSRVLILCGRGNKAGDGLVAARYLKGLGCRASFEMIPPKAGSNYSPEILQNLKRAHAAGVQGRQWGEDKADPVDRLSTAALLIDAVLGTGSTGNPRGDAERMIRAMSRAGKPILAIDLPSGLDPDTGKPGDPCVRARWTLTMALPKKGLLVPSAHDYVGELKVLDIGFPKELVG